jgi:hypothetical protein
MHYLLSPQASTTERDAAPLYLGLSWSRDLDLDPLSPRSAPPPWQLSLVQPGLAVWCMWVQHGGISAEHLVSLVLLQCASLAILSLGNAIACVPPFCLPSSFLEAFSHVRSCDVLPHAYVCFYAKNKGHFPASNTHHVMSQIQSIRVYRLFPLVSNERRVQAPDLHFPYVMLPSPSRTSRLGPV